MYRKCVTEHSVHNQRNLEHTLLELMLKMPYGDISVTNICQEAGVSRRIFYHLFGSKQDALYALIDHTILDAGSFRTEDTNLSLCFFQYWKTQERLLEALCRNQLWSILFERMLSSVMQEDYDVWRWLRAEDPEKRKEILVFNLSGIMGLVLMWYYSGFQRSPEEMAQMMENLMHKPLAKMQL